MGGYDPSRYPIVRDWPIREGLMSYVQILKKDAMEDYRLHVLACSVVGAKPPEIPAILKNG